MTMVGKHQPFLQQEVPSIFQNHFEHFHLKHFVATEGNQDIANTPLNYPAFFLCDAEDFMAELRFIVECKKYCLAGFLRVGMDSISCGLVWTKQLPTPWSFIVVRDRTG